MRGTRKRAREAEDLRSVREASSTTSESNDGDPLDADFRPSSDCSEGSDDVYENGHRKGKDKAKGKGKGKGKGGDSSHETLSAADLLSGSEPLFAPPLSPPPRHWSGWDRPNLNNDDDDEDEDDGDDAIEESADGLCAPSEVRHDIGRSLNGDGATPVPEGCRGGGDAVPPRKEMRRPNGRLTGWMLDLLDEARYLVQRGDYREALSFIQQLLMHRPRLGEAYTLMAECYQRLRDGRRLVAVVLLARKLVPHAAESVDWRRLARVAVAEGMIDEALHCIELGSQVLRNLRPVNADGGADLDQRREDLREWNIFVLAVNIRAGCFMDTLPAATWLLDEMAMSGAALHVENLLLCAQVLRHVDMCEQLADLLSRFRVPLLAASEVASADSAVWSLLCEWMEALFKLERFVELADLGNVVQSQRPAMVDVWHGLGALSSGDCSPLVYSRIARVGELDPTVFPAFFVQVVRLAARRLPTRMGDILSLVGAAMGRLRSSVFLDWLNGLLLRERGRDAEAVTLLEEAFSSLKSNVTLLVDYVLSVESVPEHVVSDEILAQGLPDPRSASAVVRYVMSVAAASRLSGWKSTVFTFARKLLRLMDESPSAMVHNLAIALLDLWAAEPLPGERLIFRAPSMHCGDMVVALGTFTYFRFTSRVLLAEAARGAARNWAPIASLRLRAFNWDQSVLTSARIQRTAVYFFYCSTVYLDARNRAVGDCSKQLRDTSLRMVRIALRARLLTHRIVNIAFSTLPRTSGAERMIRLRGATLTSAMATPLGLLMLLVTSLAKNRKQLFTQRFTGPLLLEHRDFVDAHAGVQLLLAVNCLRRMTVYYPRMSLRSVVESAALISAVSDSDAHLGAYSYARLLQYIGSLSAAASIYERLLETLPAAAGQLARHDSLAREAAHNLALIYSASGANDLAFQRLQEHCSLK